MRTRPTLWFAAFVLSVPAGCVSFYSRKPVTFHVFDFDTRAPVQGARASVVYDRMTKPFAINPPKGMDAVTDEDGWVELRAAFNWSPAFSFEADGYCRESVSFLIPGL